MHCSGVTASAEQMYVQMCTATADAACSILAAARQDKTRDYRHGQEARSHLALQMPCLLGLQMHQMLLLGVHVCCSLPKMLANSDPVCHACCKVSTELSGLVLQLLSSLGF